MVDRSLRSPDGRWIVDVLVGEPARYRVWDEGEDAASFSHIEQLRVFLGHYGVDVGDLVPEDDDPWSE